MDREIERDFDAEPGRGSDKTAKIGPGAEPRLDGTVAAFGGADRIRAARILRRRDHSVVAPLAVDPADRVNRHEIDDIEAERRDIAEPLDAIRESGAALRVPALAAREHLVPRREPRLRPIDDQLEFTPVAHPIAAVPGARHQLAQFGRQRHLAAAPAIGRRQIVEQLAQPRLELAAHPARRSLDEPSAFDQLQLHALPGVALFDEIVAPALEPVGPGLDRVAPAADPVGAEARHPAVVVVKRERRLLPILGLEGIEQRGGELVMAVAEDVGPHLDLLADNPLCRIAAGVDLRVDRLDHDARLRPPCRMMRRVAAGAAAWPGQHLPERPQRGAQYPHLERCERKPRRDRRLAGTGPRLAE